MKNRRRRHRRVSRRSTKNIDNGGDVCTGKWSPRLLVIFNANRPNKWHFQLSQGFARHSAQFADCYAGSRVRVRPLHDGHINEAVQ